ncbi:hypothetical protein GOBAR_AA11725 [Gossypium barbadense]|uniref:Piwi domain-containing protein n=1 Tax=Gossypium barbadense TaxID=3634 RepID=A0A2P5Y001_GOSBA|nr:hypothetical protein GOBAR_AA11725 [Gossypium barbadense]
MLTLGQTPSIPVVLKVSAIILGMGALFGSPEQSDMPSIAVMVSSKRWPLISRGIRYEVSESQFNQVLIKLLRLASSLTRSGTLKIVVVVVRKTIIPSFFQQGSPENVLHGIVIDNKVCHPKNNDFYLGTHAGMIRITRQTHYHVLLDQAGFSADDLQDWGQFMKIRDASETSSSHGGMYVPEVIPVPQLSRLKDKVSNFILVC